DIGSGDITAHVDFAQIRKIAINSGIKTSNTLTQNEFLHKLGIKERLNILSSNSGEYGDILLRQYKRLVEPNQMGILFKAICLAVQGQYIFLFEEI
ncbi:MAG: hypothetical protein SFT68_02795, partial [Rickettsiaceae bacterium]|nr:hypothetical protein [Rickettsiaceae bacterium]